MGTMGTMPLPLRLVKRFCYAAQGWPWALRKPSPGWAAFSRPDFLPLTAHPQQRLQQLPEQAQPSRRQPDRCEGLTQDLSGTVNSTRFIIRFPFSLISFQSCARNYSWLGLRKSLLWATGHFCFLLFSLRKTMQVTLETPLLDLWG